MARGECKHAGEKNSAGLIWCKVSKCFVSGQERETCDKWEAK